ncbi:MAG: hypothetical protein JXN64_00345, partial [Spirochaetes bacterium]|nr:hypothetical protein [Spirochaetota bacterium]
VKKVDSESKESLLQKVKKVDSESKESLLHNNNSIYTDINTVIIADKSAEDIPAKYFHKKLIPTFFAGYKSIYNEKLIFSKKEIGCIHTLVQTKILKYSTFKEQKETTRRKIELLRDIAVQKNPFQNWQFLPSQLLQHWDQLVEGCVKKIKGNRVIDLKSNLADWEKIEREYETKHV